MQHSAVAAQCIEMNAQFVLLHELPSDGRTWIHRTPGFRLVPGAAAATVSYIGTSRPVPRESSAQIFDPFRSLFIASYGEYECGEKLISTRINVLHLT